MYPLVRMDANRMTDSQKDILCDCFQDWFNKKLVWKKAKNSGLNEVIFSVELLEEEAPNLSMSSYIMGWFDCVCN